MSGDEQNSLLTAAFRKLITSDPEHSALERKNRNRMRKRVKQGLADICLLNQYARTDDIQQIFHKENNRNDAQPTQKVDGREEPVSNRWVAARHMVSLAWRGLRLNDVDKSVIFERVIVRGIEDAEADYKGVPHGRVESEIGFEKLRAVEDWDDLDPTEKIQKEISLSSDDFQEIHDRLSEHPEVDSLAGENIIDLAKDHLIDE
jgi:hypothetical protein